MEKRNAKKFAYLGAGAGLGLFTLFGLLYGFLLAGVMGLQLTGMIFGPGEFGILARIIVSLGILFGVLLAALACVTGTATLGYLVGLVIDAIKETRTGSLKIHNAAANK
ncbi:hypothetical protein [Desulfurivibrio sp. C05AmB]|uniref:hypothetical protein n=1 Tax=Desulfurivibrio sp. C05AmB TaxID=3374371 RepID=UPI00376EE1D0